MQEENEVDADGQAAEDPNADLQASKVSKKGGHNRVYGKLSGSSV